jgi:hypothetical protein
LQVKNYNLNISFPNALEKSAENNNIFQFVNGGNSEHPSRGAFVSTMTKSTWQDGAFCRSRGRLLVAQTVA